SLAPGVYVSQYGDTHDASRMLLLDRIRECKVMGRPVVMIPNRNTMLITGESDADGVCTMLNHAEEVLKHPRPMACIPLVLSEKTWYEWQVRADHPEQKRFQRLRAIAMNDIYNSHKELLDALHAEEEKDIFVASYMAMENKDTGEIMSCATWSDGVHTLLPR